jgi:hypothetical protein
MHEDTLAQCLSSPFPNRGHSNRHSIAPAAATSHSLPAVFTHPPIPPPENLQQPPQRNWTLTRGSRRQSPSSTSRSPPGVRPFTPSFLIFSFHFPTTILATLLSTNTSLFFFLKELRAYSPNSPYSGLLSSKSLPRLQPRHFRQHPKTTTIIHSKSARTTLTRLRPLRRLSSNPLPHPFSNHFLELFSFQIMVATVVARRPSPSTYIGRPATQVVNRPTSTSALTPQPPTSSTRLRHPVRPPSFLSLVSILINLSP